MSFDRERDVFLPLAIGFILGAWAHSIWTHTPPTFLPPAPVPSPEVAAPYFYTYPHTEPPQFSINPLPRPINCGRPIAVTNGLGSSASVTISNVTSGRLSLDPDYFLMRH